jgi:hypothetical protein
MISSDGVASGLMHPPEAPWSRRVDLGGGDRHARRLGRRRPNVWRRLGRDAGAGRCEAQS